MEELPDPAEGTSEVVTPLKALNAMCEEMAQLLEAATALIEPEDDKDRQEDAEEDHGIVGADIVPETP